MIVNDPNKNTSESCLAEAENRAYENLRAQVAKDLIKLAAEHDMSPEYMAEKLNLSPVAYKFLLWDRDISLRELNEIASVFSHEPVILFRKRWPATHN